ncbi:MAG: response regulator [Rugosibacter sp.]|nr:response regulator [Rugosibacter sp.]
MVASKPSRPAILIATDSITDAEQVRKLLVEEFDNIFTTTDPDTAAQDFERRQPGVLVLAFNSVEKAERYSLGLYRLCPAVQQTLHRTIILCGKDDVKQVYSLCKKSYFDDYVLFWPMTYDMSRLGMTIHHAMRELAVVRDSGPSTAEFAAQARRLVELERLLKNRLADGDQHITVANRAMAQVEKDVSAALDGFSRRLVDGTLKDAITVNDANVLREEIGRLTHVEVGAGFRKAAELTAPLKQWADDVNQECAPFMDSARALGVLADQIQPIVLVVDDDEFQCKIMARILEAENYRLLFAHSGVEALGLLRRTRPDLILMDVMLPDMDGMETTRRVKAIPEFARIPVIMITGKSEKNVITESLKVGATGFLVKPFERDMLITKVRQALNRV